MRGSRLIAPTLAVLAAASAFAACGDDETGTTAGPSGQTSSTSTGGTGGSGGTGATGGNATVGGAGGVGGGSGGSLGPEDCLNGLDDNGDGRIDCLDNDPMCAPVCGAACAQPTELDDPASVYGDTTSHPVLDGTCTAGQGAGPTHVYQVTASQAGVLEASLTTASEMDNFTLSIRTNCGSAQSEVQCAENVTAHEPPAQEFVSVAATMGQTFYVVVHGFSFLDYGQYQLTVATRVPSCPDTFLDAGEECDDGDMIDDNACSNMCEFQPTETESNNIPTDADDFVDPWYAAITPVGDTDLVKITVPENDYGLLVNVFDIGNGDCAMARLDSYVQLFDSALTELRFDDNSGDGLCSALTGRSLAQGDYYLRVTASPTGLPNHTFQYTLMVEGDECGNGTVAGPEECDDNNTTSGDGCSQFCTIE